MGRNCQTGDDAPVIYFLVQFKIRSISTVTLGGPRDASLEVLSLF